ncbi:MAG: RDD family protein [Phycisphaerales bacterium]|nr:RDD family protein [Phycisphaerales bacterium]
MPVMLDETLYLFWAEKAEYVELHGGWMVTNGGALDLTIPHQNMLPPMKLDGMKQLGVRDVAVGAVENSIGVMASNANGEMITYVFDSLGRKVRGPEAMKVVDSRRDVEFSQSVKIVLLALMLGLSLWRWPKRQQEEERGGGRGVGGRGKLEGGFGAVVLPEGMVTASVPRRGAAFVIDILATWIMMSIASMLMAYGGWTLRPIADWTPLIFSFDELLRLPELMAFWGLYLLHVTAGELVFQRSVGKACVGGGGIRVMMTDGKAPTPGAIVVRNLIRLPEMLLGIFVVYLLFSRGRQRLGDMVARTVVVGERSQK